MASKRKKQSDTKTSLQKPARIYIAIILFVVVMAGAIVWIINKPTTIFTPSENTTNNTDLMENELSETDRVELGIMNQINSKLPSDKKQQRLKAIYISGDVVVSVLLPNDEVLATDEADLINNSTQDYEEYVYSVQEDEGFEIVHTGELLPCDLVERYPLFPDDLTQECD